ncbi:prolyl oligopeptidase family serine peptidase [Streptomyces sp. NPDC005529]|uniref:S9 family peptidase n=1 Tax=unclassified Streptomyces TaxID=2593676 RepID=UPI0033B1C672
MGTYSLSWDGTRIAHVDTDGTLAVTEPATATTRQLHQFTAQTVHTMRWSPDDTHLLLITEDTGQERFTPHALRLSDTTLRPLAPAGTVQARGLWTAPDHPHTLVTAIRRRGDRALHPWRIPLTHDQDFARPIAHSPDGTRDWAFDTTLTCRACLTTHPDGSLTLLTAPDGHRWNRLARFSLDDASDTQLLGIDHTTQEVLLLTAHEAEAVRVLAIHPHTGHRRTSLAAPPYDMTTACLAPDGTPRAALHHGTRRHYTSTDLTYARDLTRAATLDPGDLELLTRDGTDDHWLLAFHHPAHAPRHYLFDRRTATGTPLRQRDTPQARHRAPVETTVLHLTASDGHPLTAYLTHPTHTHVPPLVLRIHGGPWTRDHWRHDPEAHQLATDGFAVLRVNYRGSTGYGRTFRNLGDGEWGARMQQDLYDAIDAVTRQGAAAPGRVAAYGGSYGGYAALLALTDPRIHCAIAVNPLVDLTASDWANSPYWRRVQPLWDKQIGWSRLHRSELRHRSPLHRVTDMHGPTLIARGANDPRIDAKSIDTFIQARQATGGTVTELILPNDGHTIRSTHGRTSLGQAVSAFLTQHLAPPSD